MRYNERLVQLHTRLERQHSRRQVALSQDCPETIRSSHLALPIGERRVADIRLESGPIKGEKHCGIMRPLFHILLIGFLGLLDGSVMISGLPIPLWGLFGKYMFVEHLVILLYQSKWVEISFQQRTGETVICHLSPLLLHRGFPSKTFAIKRCKLLHTSQGSFLDILLV